ncbi:hypothetical protein [Microbacterium kunmingense]|uniref:hypothetical protein n=1 Tax=Microbacterium kunmingense TaxID=2915939 RepID=UPI002004017B|nr:hypothetical protein [Microbacterium kunmingense]
MVLVALALQHSRSDGVAAPNPVPTFTLGVTTPTPTPTWEAPSPEPQASRADERFLTTGSAVWWRGVAGECGVTEPVIERSDDGGATWTDVTPRYLGIGEVMAMNAFSAADAEMVAAMGPTCEVQALRTYTGGEFWEPYPEVLAASRYLDSADPSLVILLGEPVPAPCPAPTGLRTSGDTAALICDGVAWTRTGANWTPLTPTGVAALTLVGPDIVLAHADASCDGTAVSRVAENDLAGPQPVGCAAGTDPASPTAVTIRDGDLLVWSRDALAVLEGVA